MTSVEWTVDLLGGLIPDVNCRADVTVTYPGHRPYFDPVTGAADPGSGPEIMVDSIALEVPSTGRMVAGHYVSDFEYLKEHDRDEGPIARMVREALESDPDFIEQAVQQARSAA